MDDRKAIPALWCHAQAIVAVTLDYYSNLRSFSNLSVSSPTSQLILQPFSRFTYVTAHSPTLLPLLLRQRFFAYFTWRAAHASSDKTFSYA